MIWEAQLEAPAAWAYSSVVEHCVDIAGVASSILATPTIPSADFPLSAPGRDERENIASFRQHTCH
jgi:hypothetical protein